MKKRVDFFFHPSCLNPTSNSELWLSLPWVQGLGYPAKKRLRQIAPTPLDLVESGLRLGSLPRVDADVFFFFRGFVSSY